MKPLLIAPFKFPSTNFCKSSSFVIILPTFASSLPFVITLTLLWKIAARSKAFSIDKMMNFVFSPKQDNKDNTIKSPPVSSPRPSLWMQSKGKQQLIFGKEKSKPKLSSWTQLLLPHTQMLSTHKRGNVRGWRECSAVKNCFSSKGPKFCSPHPSQVAHNCPWLYFTVPNTHFWFLGALLSLTCAHTTTRTHTNIYTQVHNIATETTLTWMLSLHFSILLAKNNYYHELSEYVPLDTVHIKVYKL